MINLTVFLEDDCIVVPRLIRYGTRSRTVRRVVLGSRLDHKPNTQYILPNSSGNAGSRVQLIGTNRVS
ncbi:hypothetical protein NSMM_820032 [Nitrosomonas mobilis]|uniref:Uncharacterized protein n=1 Tax=Nitrosomonas mobilis TaxID=51642 RepID=A0A1G5SIW9_9PROT|nr:hypothetical protein NSMM_820032 [Nitrosomonas mobilis]